MGNMSIGARCARLSGVFMQMRKYPISCLFRCISSSRSLKDICKIFKSPIEAGASVKDITDGDKYSYSSIKVIDKAMTSEEFCASIMAWLECHQSTLTELKCDEKWIEICFSLDEGMPYEGVSMPAKALSYLANARCFLTVTCYRKVNDKDKERDTIKKGVGPKAPMKAGET